MQSLLKTLLYLILACSFSTSFAANNKTSYKLAKCVSQISQDDVIAVDHDKNGTPVEFKRNNDDIKKVIIRLKEKIKDDPSITKSKYWHKEMLTPDYWLFTVCGGTKDCSSKTCDNGKPCTYKGSGMSGCSCS